MLISSISSSTVDTQRYHLEDVIVIDDRVLPTWLLPFPYGPSAPFGRRGGRPFFPLWLFGTVGGDGSELSHDGRPDEVLAALEQHPGELE